MRSRRLPQSWPTTRKNRWPRRLRRPAKASPDGTHHRWLATLAPWATVLVAIAALIYTNQANAHQLENQQEANRAQLDANRAQQRLAEQGQITDRFSRAIEQLGQPGADKLDIRLGGIYALERLMRDSPADEPAIVEVLCALVRERRTPEPAPSPSPTRGVVLSPAADVQAALTVLGRRPNPGDRRTRINLAGANLSGANLVGANLDHANLIRAYLVGATLTDAHLTGANLANANLSGAYLANTDLSGGYLVGANLTGAHLIDANLSDADLSGADLTDATLLHTNMSGTKLGGANMTRTRR
jgi:hypothetical protein